MTVAGIDPGKTGALAILQDHALVYADVPRGTVKGKDKPLWTEWRTIWADALDVLAPELIVIELVASRPNQGSASGFNFGRSFGFAHAIAIASGARVEFVTPSVWKGKLGLLNSDKNASREAARAMLPTHAEAFKRVRDDGRAEAALLAHYGRKYLCMS